MQRAWQIVVHEMESKPHVDPMLVRLISMLLSFKNCPKKKLFVFVRGKKEQASASDARQKALAAAFAAALRIRECGKTQEEQNCQTITRFLQLRKTLQLHFEPLDEEHPPDSQSAFFAGGDLEPFQPSEVASLQDEIEEDVQADVTFGKRAPGAWLDLGRLKLLYFSRGWRQLTATDGK